MKENFKTTFTQQPAPKSNPDRNDNFYDRIFHLHKCNFQIKIKPVKSAYWRFGFQFSEDTTFPPINESRHSNGKIGDIHICVGDAEAVPNNNTLRWINPNRLYLTEYHVQIEKDDFKSSEDYKTDSEVVLTISSQNESEFYISIMVNDKIIGSRIYNLSKFQYCKIAAWSDHNNFQLDTEIAITHKNPYTFNEVTKAWD